nr:GGDEF domain-containing protein [Amycolatopsis nigrescens]
MNWVTKAADFAVPDGEKDLLDPHESLACRFAASGDWRQAYEQLRHALDLAREQGRRDALTGAYNRRFLDRRLLDLVRGPACALALAMVDLDRFKRINDTFGHLAGDRVLCRVATLLQDDLPAGGFCARYGGEEFVLVLPGTTAGSALMIAERARARVAGHTWAEVCPGLSVTVSIGVAHEPSPAAGHRQLRRADDLLYAAKDAGRNTVSYWQRDRVRVIKHRT